MQTQETLGERHNSNKYSLFSSYKNERSLEEHIFKDISVLNSEWLVIGRQIRTDYHHYIDLLAIDASGAIYIIEVNNQRNPHGLIERTIDYALWVQKLGAKELAQLYKETTVKFGLPSKEFEDVIQLKFGSNISAEDINRYQQIYIVAPEIGDRTKRVVKYLNNKETFVIEAIEFCSE